MNFWQTLKKPIFALAPMEAVTNCAFREIYAKYGKPDIMFTEFLNVDGLTHPEGYEHLKIDLEYTEKQRPIVAQIWGRDPEKFFKAAQLVVSLGFDGVDINMGCPQEKEISQKTCAALIREPKLAGEIIEATIQGAGGKPVSVKTRLGYTKTEEMAGWVSHLFNFPIANLTLHARTKQEKSKVPAHWEKIKEAVEIRNELFKDKENRPLILGNGDVKSREEGLARISETGCDGVMVGRGAFGNPWIFRPDFYQPALAEKIGVMLEHAALYEQMYNSKKPFITMRKNFKAYVSGFNGAHELRAKLMETKNLSETREIIEQYLKLTE